MLESDPNAALQPFELDVREKAKTAARRARGAALAQRLRGAKARTAQAAASARARLLRASLEARAVARSSAALSGISKDLKRIRGRLEAGTAGHSAALQGLRADLQRIDREVRAILGQFGDVFPKEVGALMRPLGEDLARLGSRLRRAEEQGKAKMMRSSTLAGLAIDSKRVARRLREGRESRRRRASQ